jgi:ubiquitin carboxyl-terminal hydrolase 25/28
MPSESSTRVNSPNTSPTIPNTSLPGSPVRPEVIRASSVLGKRPSEDRDDSSRSSEDNSRQKNDGFEDLGDITPIQAGVEDDYELVSGLSIEGRVESPSAATDLGALKLKSPELETREAQVTMPDPPPMEDLSNDNSTVPPPLPPRPTVARKDTLASGLRFGLQQDSAEVLINVLTQLEMAFDPSTAEGESERPNLISEWATCHTKVHTQKLTRPGCFRASTANRHSTNRHQAPSRRKLRSSLSLFIRSSE